MLMRNWETAQPSRNAGRLGSVNRAAWLGRDGALAIPGWFGRGAASMRRAGAECCWGMGVLGVSMASLAGMGGP